VSAGHVADEPMEKNKKKKIKIIFEKKTEQQNKPLQVSAISQSPATERQTTPFALNESVGHVAELTIKQKF